MKSRILLVDDLKDSLQLLSKMLSIHLPDAQITACTSGAEALALLGREAYDIVLLDAKMPNMTGFEVCQRIKADPALTLIPVLMVSGIMVDSRDRAAGLECGAEGYLCKPFEPSELIAQVRMLLRIKRNEDELRSHQEQLERELALRTQTLRDSEERFRTLFNSSPDAIFVEDAAGIVLDVNEAACRLHGLPRAKIVGRHVLELVPVADRERVRRDFAKWFTGEIREYRGSSWTVGDKSVPVEIRAGRIRYDGKDAIVLNCRDISWQQANEGRLSATVIWLRKVVGIADELIACPDLDSLYRRAVELSRERLELERCGILVERDGQVCGTYGTDVHGKTTDERTHRLPMDETWREHFRFRKSDEPRWSIHEGPYEFIDKGSTQHTGKAGSIVTTPIQSARKAYGAFFNDNALSGAGIDFAKQEVVAVFCTLLGNIAERKIAEADRNLLAQAVEQTADMVVVTDPQSRIQYVNSAFTRISGFSAAEAIGNTPRMLNSGRHGSEFFRQMFEVLAKGQVWHGQLTNRRKDGSEYLSEMTISPVRDVTGTIMQYIAVSQDVTRAAQMESELRQAQKMESIGLLAGGIAHDFNNLLTAISGFARVVHDDLAVADPHRIDLAEILQASDRATRLTQQLLALGRKNLAQLQAVDLGSIVTNMAQILRRTLGDDIIVDTAMDERVGPIDADVGLIEQVLMNLAVNSREAMPKGGRLTLGTASVQLDEAYARQHVGVVPGPYSILKVRDTGRGMTPEVRERIFEPFFTTKEGGRGSGLGLSTAYGIVKQCRGHIEVDSTPGVGTELRLFFPRTSAPIRAPSRDPDKPVAGGHETILLVEDEDIVRRLTLRMLKHLGYHVLEARNGVEGLESLRDHPNGINAIVTDVVMPEMGGPEMVEAMRQFSPDMRVLYITGFAEDVVLDRVKDGRGSALLTKPFTREALAAAVRRVIDGV